MSGFGAIGKEVRLGRPFGIPLTIDVLLLGLIGVIFGFALLTRQPLEGVWIVVIFVSILLHEWAHALTARAAGDTVFKVMLHLLGGVTLRAGRGGPKWDWWITAAGPLTNVALAAAAWGTLRLAPPGALPPWAVLILGQTWWINAVLAVFNLLPIHPMDGGRLARISLSRRVGAGPGARVALGLSLFTLVATGLYCAASGMLNIIVIVLLAQMFMLNVMEMRQIGTPSTTETRTVLARWWAGRREESAQRRAERERRRADERAAGLEPSPFRRERSATSRDDEVLRDGKKALAKAVDRGLGALSPEERRLLILHRRLIEIRVDTASGTPSPDDLRLLEQHVRLGASGEVH